jgi:hypothetical protein
MSAHNIFKETQEKPTMNHCFNTVTRKTSIDPFALNNVHVFESQSDIQRIQTTPDNTRSYKIPKIEHWESSSSKDGMAINVFLNIKFNLRNIMVVPFISLWVGIRSLIAR